MRYRQLKTPRSAAFAGILFSLLFAGCLILIRTTIPENISIGMNWEQQAIGRLRFAMGLMPFAGIAYLWYIGVLRDQLGNLEDKFFATVFFGSGLLFLALAFVSMSIIGAIIAFVRINPEVTANDAVISFGRAIMFQVSNVYALRMAGVFMISLGTIWLRTGIMPRWLGILTYLLAAILLVAINQTLWVTLIFPVWVFMTSLLVLTTPIYHED